MSDDLIKPGMDLSSSESQTRFSVVIEGRHLDITEAVEEAARALTADLRAESEKWKSAWTDGEEKYDRTYAKWQDAEARATAAEAARDAAMAGAVRVNMEAADKALAANEIEMLGCYDVEADLYKADPEAADARRAFLGHLFSVAIEPHPGAQDREALVAATLERAAGSLPSCGACGGRDNIEALATQPQTDALAAVRLEARAPLIAALRGCIETADMVAADLQDKRAAAGSDMNAASLMANNRAARAILASAEKESGHD